MKTDLICAETREELASKIEKKVDEGWQTASEIVAVRVPNLDNDVPNFVFYAQVMKKNDEV